VWASAAAAAVAAAVAVAADAVAAGAVAAVMVVSPGAPWYGGMRTGEEGADLRMGAAPRPRPTPPPPFAFVAKHRARAPRVAPLVTAPPPTVGGARPEADGTVPKVQCRGAAIAAIAALTARPALSMHSARSRVWSADRGGATSAGRYAQSPDRSGRAGRHGTAAQRHL